MSSDFLLVKTLLAKDEIVREKNKKLGELTKDETT